MKDLSDVGSLSCRVTFKPVSIPLQYGLLFSRSKLVKSFVLKAKLDSEQSAPEAEIIVKEGDVGKAITPLRPAGTVLINGERYSALSEGDFIAAGREIEVLSEHQKQLLVKEHNLKK